MTNFIPIFPLNVVIYPGEQLNLHIFEPRYKQLVEECFAGNKMFGIPAVIGNRLQDYGTLIRVTNIVTVYDDGKMDVQTQGEKVFRILEVIKEVPEKLYSGAIVNYPQNHERGNPEVMRRVMNSIQELHKLLKVEKNFDKSAEELKSYDVAHHVGLSIEEEYELLGLMHERQRQEYLKRHLVKVIPLVAEMELLKEKAKMNGHFRNLSAFNFDF